MMPEIERGSRGGHVYIQMISMSSGIRTGRILGFKKCFIYIYAATPPPFLLVRGLENEQNLRAENAQLVCCDLARCLFHKAVRIGTHDSTHDW